MSADSREAARLAFRFVLVVGVANFFADFTYEGARSVIGPFLGSLGASAAVIGFVAGFGEMVGYGLRSVSGYFADKTHRYWLTAFAGYAINMLAVPALALAGSWPACCCIGCRGKNRARYSPPLCRVNVGSRRRKHWTWVGIRPERST